MRSSCRVPSRIVRLASLAIACVAPRAGEGAPPRAAPRVAADAAPRAHAGLLDCRSVTVAHEVRQPRETPLRIGAASLRLEVVGGRGRLVVLDAPDAAPRIVPLKASAALVEFPAFGVAYGVSARLVDDGESVALASAFGLRIALGAEVAYWVDSDLDGRLSAERDGVVAPGARTVAPWRGEAWHRSVGAAVAIDPVTGAYAATRLPDPRPEDADHAEAWRLLQWRRQQAGVAPLVYDASLEPGLVAHARYLEANGEYGHEETPGKPGWSAEGARAGLATVLHKPVSGCVEGVEVELATLFHRHAVLRGGLVRSAMRKVGDLFLAWVQPDPRGPFLDAVVVWPPHGASDVRTRFHEGGERPMPVPVAPSPNALGTCVGVERWSWREGTLSADAEFVVETADGKRVEPVSLHGPGRPPSHAALYDRDGVVGLVPGRALGGARAYRARAAWTVTGPSVLPRGAASAFAYEWEFTTER